MTGAIDEDRAIDVFKKGATDYVLKSHLSRLAPAAKRALAEAEERSAHRKTQEELRESYKTLENLFKDSKTKYSLILETVQSGFLLCDKSGKILEANQAYRRMSGYPLEELLRITVQDLEAHDSPEELRQYAQLVKAHGHYQFERRHRRKNGTVFDVDVRASFLNVEGGRFVNFVWDITDRKKSEEQLKKEFADAEIIVKERTALLAEMNTALMEEITERKHKEIELRQSEEKYRRLFENNLAGVAVASLDLRSYVTKLFDCNDAFSGILGFASREQLLSLDAEKFFDAAPGGDTLLARLLKNKKLINEEFCLLTKNQEPVWVLLNLILHKRGKSDVALIEGTMIDISLRKQAEKEMQSAHRKLQAMASQLIRTEEREHHRMAAAIHDTVAQTLAAAKMHFESVREYVSPDGLKSVAEVRHLLAQAMRQTRSIMTELSPPVLNELGLIPALEWLAEQITQEHELSVDLAVENKVPKMPHDFQVLFYQATRELLTNIVKHAKVHKAKVTVSNIDGSLQIKVSDDGIGFNRYNIEDHSDVNGGFGLFGIRERFKQFDGTFDITSEVGRGTEITMAAPLRTEASTKQKGTGR